MEAFGSARAWWGPMPGDRGADLRDVALREGLAVQTALITAWTELRGLRDPLSSNRGHRILYQRAPMPRPGVEAVGRGPRIFLSRACMADDAPDGG